jgi:hypothetical protein
MNRTNIIIIASIVGVGVLAVVLYMQAAKRKKQIADTEKIYQDSIKQTTPTPQVTPGSDPFGLLSPQVNPYSNNNNDIPTGQTTAPGGGVLLPEYQNTGLGFMPGMNLTSN